MNIRIMKVVFTTGLLVSAVYASNSFAVTADDVICDGCVGRVDIGPNEVRAGHIKSYQINAWHLKAGVVKTIKIADGAVNSAKVLDNSLTSSDLGANSVGASELAPNSVYSSDIVDGQVGTADVANNSLTAADLAADSVGNSELGPNAVYGSNILNGTITGSDIAPNSIKATDLFQEAGVDYDTNDSLSLASVSDCFANTNLASHAITVPPSTTVIAVVSAQGRVSHSTNDHYVRLSLDDASGGTGYDGYPIYTYKKSDETGTYENYKGYNLQLVYPVTNTSTTTSLVKTFYLKACKETGATGTVYWNSMVTAVFPTSY